MKFLRLARAFLLACFTTFLLSAQNVFLAAPATQARVHFSPTITENNFPKSLSFHSSVKSDLLVTAAQLFYYFRNDSSVNRVDLEITPSNELELSYVWDTTRITIAPSSPIFYYWQVTLDTGEKVKSEEELVNYDDSRFEWRVREKDNLSLWWHDRDESFGENAFAIATLALDSQQKLFGTKLEYPIFIIIYNNHEEFAEWHNTSTDLIGGQAFSSLGITTQIVRNNSWQTEWLNEVIPHEISHLYFYQVSYHPMAQTPSWLNEGIAQYNEIGDKNRALQDAKRNILAEKYIPLRALAGSFGHDKEKFGQAYNESFSAVNYLITSYGEEGLANLIAAYKSGKPTRDAFPFALGVTVETFEHDWLASLGVPEGMYPTPLPTATILSMPGWLTKVAEGTSTPEVTRTPTKSSSTLPSPPSDPPHSNLVQGATPIIFALACCGNIVLIIAFLIFLRQDRKSQPS